MKRILIALAILVGVGLVAIVAFIFYASRDVPEPDVSDLAVERPEISSENNAYTYFKSAGETLHWPKNSDVVTDYLDGKSVDMEALKEVLAKNREILNHLNRGIECQRCITPEVTGFDTVMPYISPWNKMGRLLAAKTRYERLAGHYADATDTCISLLNFADLIQQDSEALINYLVGVAILDRGLTQIRDLASDPDMPASELKVLSTAIDELGSLVPGLVRAIKGEYKMAANTIEDLVKGNDPSGINGSELPSKMKGRQIPGYLFQPNRTKQTFANVYRDMIRNAPLTYAKMNRYDFKDKLGLTDSAWKLLYRPNSIGKILYNLLLPAQNMLLERKCRTECEVTATRLLVAIHSYRKDTGKIPATLKDLVPGYIDEVPADPFDGQQFRYNPEKRIIYSVGKDGKDSGGKSKLLSGNESDTHSDNRWNSEDVVYKSK